MKAFMTAFLTLAIAFSMTACSACESRNNESSSSSSMNSSMAPSSSDVSSLPSSSMPSDTSKPDLIEDVESGASDLMSAAESLVSPTMSTDFDEIGALDTQMVTWGPGVQVDENNRTLGSLSMQEAYGHLGAYFIAPQEGGKFYLTFDEGYEQGYTGQILDVLKEKGAHAVFFVTLDYVKTCPDLVQRMIDEGHIVGNHTCHHWNPTQKTLDEAYEDIAGLHEYMLENFDYEMFLYRPPEGAFSEQVLAMVQQTGYTTVLWSFAYSDWDPNNQPSYEDALARTEKFIHEGAIYLLHAVSQTNTEILPALIDEVRAQGLEICDWDLPYIPCEG